MVNTSDAVYKRDLFLLAFVDPEGFNDKQQQYTRADLDSCDEGIAECREMLAWAIESDDQEEIKTWKRYLQQAKTQKRMIRKMIEEQSDERMFLTA